MQNYRRPSSTLARALSALVVTTVAATSAGSVYAASPLLKNILPRGAQRGTEIDVLLTGARLSDAEDVLLYEPGIEASDLKATNDTTLKAHLKIAPDAELGEHHVRVRCKSGISELRTFWVGPFPTIYPATQPVKNKAGQVVTNNQFETAQKIPLNVTVEGVIPNEQVSYYQIEAKKGQQITAEVEGIRLGNTMFDPAVSVVDMNHFELAAADDTALLKQDCFVSVIVPSDGEYVVAVRDSAFGGNGESHYRMHVGTFPRPTAVFPCGGKAGEKLDVKFLGDASGVITQSVQLPTQPVDELPLYAKQGEFISPSANRFRVVDYPNVMEAEPNHDLQTATTTALEMPFAFNGIVAAPRETDFYKFNLKKGVPVDITVYARRLRSPLDSVITLYDDKGRQLASNDDSGGPDSYLKFTPPADGQYAVSVRDQLGAGGWDYVYRLEITPPRSTVTLSIPNATQVNGPTQERQTINVPRGNRYATLIRATRNNAAGDWTIAGAGMPAGVTLSGERLTPNAAEGVPVIFEAAADAPVGGKLCDLVATQAPAADAAKIATPGPEMKATFEQRIELVVSNPNNTAYAGTKVNKVAVAVTEELPFKIDIVQPKVPIVQGGSMGLKVVAQRKEGFKQAIVVRVLSHPAGVAAAATVEIPADKNECVVPLSCNDGAPTKKGTIVCIASSDVKGTAWVASQMADLEVVAPYVTGKVQMTAIEQGQSGYVTVDLQQITKFEGKAKMTLVGLPSNTTAEEKEITCDDYDISFQVTASPKAQVGSSSGLLCQLTIMQNGEPIMHNIAKGGVLRIDPAPKVAPVQTAAAKAAGPTTAPTKSLSRLEKLRLEQAAAKQ